MVAAFEHMRLVDLTTTREVVGLGPTLPVGGIAGAQERTLARLVLNVEAGDVLDIEGRMRVTNDIGPREYTVGVGYYFEGCEYGSKAWFRLGSSNGDNVDPVRHHMPMDLHDVYQVSASWPPDTRFVVAFKADAHSTAWNKNGGQDRITIDNYGVLTVRRYRIFEEQ